MVRFRIIVVDDKALDWPKELPIPAKGDVVTIEDLQTKQHKAIVDKVHYLVTKSVTEIRIETNPIDYQPLPPCNMKQIKTGGDAL